MSHSTSSNISNSQIKKSQSWRTLVININSAPGKRAELENLINYNDQARVQGVGPKGPAPPLEIEKQKKKKKKGHQSKY